MLPEVGGMELLVIAAVALIVVGPKDLPMLLRKLGQFVARLRGMADDFRASFDEMARQS
ncbi:Sec-independent protein translocase protein TatB, partial [Phenylobacterium sp.]